MAFSVRPACIAWNATISGGVSGNASRAFTRSEEHTSELQSPCNLACRLLLEENKRVAESVVGRISSPPQRFEKPSYRPGTTRLPTALISGVSSHPVRSERCGLLQGTDLFPSG